MITNEVCKTKRRKENSWVSGNWFNWLEKAKLYAWEKNVNRK